MIKTLLLTNTIAPYRIPVLNKMKENDEIELTVWYLEEREKNRQWNIDHKDIKYDYECLPGIHAFIQKLDMGVHFNPGIFLKLLKKNPDVIITSGYDSLGYWSALLYCKLFRKKFIVWWGSTLESSRVQNPIVNRIRKIFFKSADSFVTYGTESAKCLMHYGVQEEKIEVGYNTVDIRYFRNKYNEYFRINRVRNDENIIKLLFIGQLIERKGLVQIIEALKHVNNSSWELRIVGSGPDEQKLKERVKEAGLESQIYFEGYKQKEELINYLVQSHCLVFPSLIEVWGLVVNEALATNTFVLASKYAGATKDIIVDKQNGLIIDPLDENDILRAFRWVMENQDYIRSQWKLSFGLWRKLHPYSYARAVSAAIKKAFSRGKTTMKNILYIQPYASHVGGVDTVLLQLVQGLDKTKYRPYVVLPAPSPYVEKYEAAGAKVLFCTLAVFGKPTDAMYYARNAVNLLRSIASLRKIVKDYKIDLIHSHKMELIGGNIVGKLLRIPTMQTVHELPRNPLAAYKFVGYLNHLFNDRVIVLCDRSKTMFQWGKRESDKLIKIYNGIDIPRDNPAKGTVLREELGLAPEDKIVITVARLSPMKGIEYLLKAACLLQNTNPEIKFIVVGDVAFDTEREYKEQLLAFANQNDLKNVYFLGLRRDVPNLLRQADLFVLPSVYDIFPTVILEAMCAELPIVATDVGGVPEMVTKETGILVPSEDELAIQKAILEIFSSNPKELGKAGKKLVQQSFTRQKYVDRTTAVYEELMKIV
ncbi:glycosyltransferase family 4 protein [Paenibacillus alkalitolerans]|uniref:glycosyltransferase family 4 protein n=1 Tax=Paenibacillus alkalitolerans TaxID=2799335 RepID=UPI0018F68A7B|nr:glycosyltransferase family 4 protein [Paenibacillus alkalitolerans]